jgi:HPt (histidine-containing phosphotransfer) domain-containing protein
MSHAADPRESGVNAPLNEPVESSAGEILDGTVFDDLLESLVQPPVVAALYRKFIGNAATFIEELRDQDAAARIDTLHTLKGSAAMMGAARMAQLAMRWQEQAQASPVQVERVSQELAGELVRFRGAVAARLNALGHSLGLPE